MEAIDGGETQLAALEQLYRERYDATVHLARLLVADRHRAEELAQDAFVRIAPRVASVDNPAAYLRTTLVNLCRDHGRRRRTAERHPDPPVDTAPPPALPGDLDEVWQAVQRLPERRRIAIRPPPLGAPPGRRCRRPARRAGRGHDRHAGPRGGPHRGQR